jgi:cysteinyl-tRNA synthetase
MRINGSTVDNREIKMIRPIMTGMITILCGLFLTIHLTPNQALCGGNHRYNLADIDPLPLADITFWGYQIQKVEDQGAVDSLDASYYDMLVLEPTRTDWSTDVTKFFDTKSMNDRLRNSMASDGVHRKLLIAYIDIGEAEDWRWYWTWSTEWDCQPPTPGDWPEYILVCDPDGWTGNYPVAYWDEEWKDIIIYGENTGTHPDRDYTSVIDETIIDGFDGIYLDWVEGFENEAVIAAAQLAGVDPAVEMINFIQEMRDYAALRNPDFLIIQQNAASLIEGHPELTTVIDAIAQEAIWFDGDATDDWNDPNGYDFPNDTSLVNYYIGYCDEYQDAGLPVFDCEYALDSADIAYANSDDVGYVPYATRRSLGRLTTTPPPGYGPSGGITETPPVVARGFELLQNYPNPFNPSTTISFTVPERGVLDAEGQTVRATLHVYSLRGILIRTLITGDLEPGRHTVHWDGRSERGERVASGIYLYRLDAGDYSSIRKMVAVK